MDIKKVSEAVQAKVKEILTMEDNQNNITKKEYIELGNLLNGLSGKDEREYVHGFMLEHEDGTKNNAISKAAKDFVKNVKKMLGDKKAIDNDVEANALLSELNKNNFGEEDKAYIIRELQKAGYNVGFIKFGVQPKQNPPVEKKPDEPKTGPVEQPKEKTEPNVIDQKPIDKKPEEKIEPKPETKPEPEKGLPDEPKTVDKNPPVIKKPPVDKKPPVTKKPPVDEKPPVNDTPEETKPLLNMPDVQEGERLGREMNKELNSTFWISDNKVLSILDHVDKKNAYSFFKELELNENNSDFAHKFPFKDIMENSNDRPLEEMQKPLSALLEQAKGFGLENTPAYVNLQQIVNDMKGSVRFDNRDTNVRKELDVDEAIKDLIKEMDKVLDNSNNDV